MDRIPLTRKLSNFYKAVREIASTLIMEVLPRVLASIFYALLIAVFLEMFGVGSGSDIDIDSLDARLIFDNLDSRLVLAFGIVLSVIFYKACTKKPDPPRQWWEE